MRPCDNVSSTEPKGGWRTYCQHQLCRSQVYTPTVPTPRERSPHLLRCGLEFMYVQGLGNSRVVLKHDLLRSNSLQTSHLHVISRETIAQCYYSRPCATRQSREVLMLRSLTMQRGEGVGSGAPVDSRTRGGTASSCRTGKAPARNVTHSTLVPNIK